MVDQIPKLHALEELHHVVEGALVAHTEVEQADRVRALQGGRRLCLALETPERRVAAVVGEAMVAFTLADALLEKLGGDSLAEMQPRFAALRRARLEDLPMDDVAWGLGYG